MRSMLIFQPDHVLDIITNSSSELFVLYGETKQVIEELIKSVYPNYRSEYHELKSTKELSVDELSAYLNYAYGLSKNIQVGNIPSNELFETSKYLSGWHFTNRDYLEKNKDIVIEAIDPKNEMFFLFSLKDNPDFVMQERLQGLGSERYHLG